VFPDPQKIIWVLLIYLGYDCPTIALLSLPVNLDILETPGK
jgi:hypothetical protein